MLTEPRVFFASERTLLAWVRTGVAIMAFGFVMAQFGLSILLLAAQHLAASIPARARNDVSNIFGIALFSTLPPADIPRPHDAIYPILLSLFLAALGLVLAVYLAV